jgi:hypothetical protein
VRRYYCTSLKERHLRWRFTVAENLCTDGSIVQTYQSKQSGALSNTLSHWALIVPTGRAHNSHECRMDCRKAGADNTSIFSTRRWSNEVSRFLVGEPSTTVPPARLYDEYDESDESKDGCGGVDWWKYVLKEAVKSNKMLHELARDVRGVELKRGKALTLTQYKAIYSKWEESSLRFLRKGHDYFTEFLSKLSLVTMPKGQTLESAFQRSKARQTPSKVLDVPSENLRLLASLCRELQEMFDDQPIMLCQTAIAKLAEPAIKNVKATRYFYIE